MQKEGHVFCNTIKYFSTLDDFVQGDELEKAWLVDNSKDSILQIKPVDAPDSEYINIKLSKLLMNREDPFGNLFCLYSLNMLEMEYGEKWMIPQKLLEKYEAYLIITNVDAFLERLHKALDTRKLCWEHHLIEYKDFSNVKTEKTIFQKDKTYDYQKEFRLFIHHDEEKEIELMLGDLSDITHVQTTENSDKKYFIKVHQPDSLK